MAINSTVGGRVLFSLKPQIVATRFNRFYWASRQPEQTTAEEWACKTVKKWQQELSQQLTSSNASSDLWPSQLHRMASELPVPLPPPWPLRSFRRSCASLDSANRDTSPDLLDPGYRLLDIVRCPTMIRLLRSLLDIGLTQSSSPSWWSDTLFDFVLHLIGVALYEEKVEALWGIGQLLICAFQLQQQDDD
ncbi:unnamed protein product [Protopolystoma xenopodis]|uniref:Uncharacterized protein n=1 Tax=Protopolystoma xenopodis TaxID=117903 RepID=A0A448WT37_9PLAT|nr:unnamed protein product [Protopolystoma xenopodis]